MSRPTARVKQKPRGKSPFVELAKTPEGRAQLAEWRAKAALSRRGRPQGATDGFTAYQRKKMIEKAYAGIDEVKAYMADQGIELPESGVAAEAIDAAIGEMRRKDLSPRDKLAAIRTVLEWSKAKPASNTNLNVTRPEDFLEALAKE